MKRVLIIIAMFLQLTPLLTIATSDKGNSDSIDTKGIEFINGRRYYFSSLYVTAPEAVTVCQELGMTLAALESLEEFYAVTDFMRVALGRTDLHYTSGSRLIDSWIWSSTGIPVSYFKWDVGNPNNQDNTKQVLICIINGYMNDCWPTFNFRFICEDQMPSCPKFTCI